MGNNVEGQVTKFDPPEKVRTYLFADRDISIENVTELIIRPSGTHRIKTADGQHWIIPAGWLAIKLNIGDWTV